MPFRKATKSHYVVRKGKNGHTKVVRRKGSFSRTTKISKKK